MDEWEWLQVDLIELRVESSWLGGLLPIEYCVTCNGTLEL
jgi:hypothetical protein